MTNAVSLWCLRHGEAESNLTGTLGALNHAPLTVRGRNQAGAAAAVLHAKPITHIYASTAMRAVETAEIIAEALHVPVTQLPGLAEVAIGSSTSGTDERVRAEALEILRTWIVDGDLDPRFAGGETGHHVSARVASALEMISAHHSRQVVAVVGHVASLTTGLHALGAIGQDVWGHPLPHAIPFHVELLGRSWRCSTWPSQAPLHTD